MTLAYEEEGRYTLNYSAKLEKLIKFCLPVSRPYCTDLSQASVNSTQHLGLLKRLNISVISPVTYLHLSVLYWSQHCVCYVD